MINNFELNYPILKERFSDLLSFIGEKKSDDFKIITSISGKITGRYKSTLLHSSFDPVKEGVKFAQSSIIASGDYVLLYGLGLGYHLKPVLDLVGASGELLVIELNQDILSAAFTLIDFTDILTQPNFKIVYGYSDKDISKKLNYILSNKWDKHPQEKCKTLIHYSSFKCIPANFKRIQNTFEVQLIEERTKAAWSELEKNNFLINQDYVKNCKGIKELVGKFKGKPAFLVSAGPSLNRVLPFLNKLTAVFYLVAVDTTLPVLLKSNIKPHFFVSIDPQDLNFNHISNYLEEDIPVILTPTVNPKTVHHYSGEKYFVIQRRSDIDDVITKDLISKKGESKGGGSVSCIALDVMVQMGFDPIVFIGQDCSFPGNRIYAENTFDDEILLDLMSGQNTIDIISQEKIKEKKEVLIESKFGESVPSHQHLYVYSKYLEQIVGNYNNVTFYNWLSMGAKVDGTIDIDSINEISSLGNFSGFSKKIINHSSQFF